MAFELDDLDPRQKKTQPKNLDAMNIDDLKEYIAFNRDFLSDVRTAKAAGKSMDDIAGSWKMPAKYTGYAAVDQLRRDWPDAQVLTKPTPARVLVEAVRRALRPSADHATAS